MGFLYGPSQPFSYLELKRTVGVSADCGGGEGRREGAVQVHREGKLLHEYKSKEREEEEEEWRRRWPELVGSLKLCNVLVLLQLIFGPRWPMNQLNKNIYFA